MSVRKRFWRDQRGVSAIEFAFIAPIMIAFYFGVGELTQTMMADRRASHVASAVGDLVTQSSQLTNAEISDIFAIAKTIMSPFPADSLGVRVISVSVDSKGAATVDWCEASSMTDLADGSSYTLPSGLVPNGQSIVVAESKYVYTSPFAKIFPNGITFNDKLYLKPRRSTKVMRTT
ncbi:MAG: hypothetical protein BGN86_02345 [Caulobacterales bacterium 68-7]|nr:MAG: hypothetical protein BGN86_02345 [Caulobacterales bacterium 68-7]